MREHKVKLSFRQLGLYPQAVKLLRVSSHTRKALSEGNLQVSVGTFNKRLTL